MRSLADRRPSAVRVENPHLPELLHCGVHSCLCLPAGSPLRTQHWPYKGDRKLSMHLMCGWRHANIWAAFKGEQGWLKPHSSYFWDYSRKREKNKHCSLVVLAEQVFRTVHHFGRVERLHRWSWWEARPSHYALGAKPQAVAVWYDTDMRLFSLPAQRFYRRPPRHWQV